MLYLTRNLAEPAPMRAFLGFGPFLIKKVFLSVFFPPLFGAAPEYNIVSFTFLNVFCFVHMATEVDQCMPYFILISKFLCAFIKRFLKMFDAAHSLKSNNTSFKVSAQAIVDSDFSVIIMQL